MQKTKICKQCLKEKPLREYYSRRRRVCKECYAARVLSKYSVRNYFEGEKVFLCKHCGGVFPTKFKSSAAKDRCIKCNRELVWARKLAAPAELTCRYCKETKPKEEFEKYSLTRCKACAREQIRKYRERS